MPQTREKTGARGLILRDFSLKTLYKEKATEMTQVGIVRLSYNSRRKPI